MFAPAIVAGLIGTVVFTAVLYAGPMMGIPKMDIIGVIGTMMVEPGSSARVLGTVGHFIMGAIFSVGYAVIWSAGIGAATWWWGAIFGVVHGLLVALVGMPLMMSMHPRAPEQEQGPMRLIGILIVHTIFGVVVALSYAALVWASPRKCARSEQSYPSPLILGRSGSRSEHSSDGDPGMTRDEYVAAR